MRKFGLIGKDISYSFSENYFKVKFEDESIKDCIYENYDLNTISEFPSIIEKTPNLKGLNVTIPFKELVIPYLDKINKKARKIGAVNTIKISRKGKLTGHNTDCYGFKKSITPHLKQHHQNALILGTGGASKAIAYALKKMNIKYAFVSRTSSKKVKFTYDELSENTLQSYQIIINCSPVGTFPNINEAPKIPYASLNENHILFDLIYNPEETRFLKLGKQQNAITINGLRMLQFQADKAWEIWNS